MCELPEVKKTPVSARVETLFKSYYKDQAREKTNQLICAAHDFVSNTTLSDVFCIQVNDILVAKLVNSYILDVIRYKEYHFSYEKGDETYESWEKKVHLEKSINESKKASFTAKWLLRTSPIAVHHLGDVTDPVQLNVIYTINEAFALRTAYRQVGIDIKSVPLEIQKDALYNFKFRNFDEYWFASNLEILERFYKDGNLQS